MAGKKFQYDETGNTSGYFILSFLALVLVPSTYYVLFRKNEREGIKNERQCQCDQCRYKRVRLQKPPARHTFRFIFIRTILLLGWMLFAYVAYQIAQNDVLVEVFNPYAILQLSEGSSEDSIKKAYRKLTLIYHPDKETGSEQKFMELTEAYRILTDETARSNWDLYGHPDGPRVASFGIALPSWIVDQDNSFMILGVYAVVLMVLLPIVVGVWWSRSIRYSRDQVLMDTTKLYPSLFAHNGEMPVKRILWALGLAAEYDSRKNPEIQIRETDDVEVPKLVREFPELEVTLPRKSKKVKRQRLVQPLYSVKAQALMYAHLSRMKLSPSLDADRIYVVSKSPVLIPEMISALEYLTVMAQYGKCRMPSLTTLENCMKLSSLTVQALREFQSPFLQLPHIREEHNRHFITRRYQVRSLEQLARMNDSDRRILLDYLTDEQYEHVVDVLGSMPCVEMSYKCEVLDDDDNKDVYNTDDIVTVTVVLVRQNMEILFGNESKAIEGVPQEVKEQVEEPSIKKVMPWQKPMKKQSPKKKIVKKRETKATTQLVKREADEQEDNKEAPNDDEASDNESSSKSDEDSGDEDQEISKLANEFQNQRRKALEPKSRISHPVHCPYFPLEKQEYWWLYVYEKTRKRIQSQPQFLTHLVDREEISLKLAAPSKPGIYTFCIALRSDSYVGFDQVKEFKLNVKKAAKKVVKEEKEEEELDESEPSDIVTDDDDSEDDEQGAGVKTMTNF